MITIMSIIQNASRYMLTIFKNMDSNSIYVFEHHPPNETKRRLGRIKLSDKNAIAIEQNCPTILAATPNNKTRSSVLYKKSETTTKIHKTYPSFQKTENWYVDEGRIFSKLD